MRAFLATVGIAMAAAHGAWAQEPQHAHGVGTVAFPVSCNAEAQTRMNQAVAALLTAVACGPVLTDPSGTAHFPPVNPGTYYLWGGNLNPRLAWNLRIDLKSGANSVTLDQRNASPFN